MSRRKKETFYEEEFNFNLELNEEQRKAYHVIESNDITILTGEAGSGKAQPLSSKVLTQDGYVEMKDISIGDIIKTPSNENAKVLGIYPQGVQDVYKITFTDGSWAESTLDHLWKISINDGKTFRVISLEEVKKLFEKYEKKGIHKVLIPISDKIEYESENLDLDSYFLGLILGDESLTTGTIDFSTKDIEILNYMNEYISKLKNINIMVKNSYTKSIPKNYLYSSVKDRIALLQGLMDTDGSVTKSGTPEFYTNSKQLKKDFIELINSLGGVAKVREKLPEYKNEIKIGKIAYTISFKLPEDIIPFRLHRKIKKLKKRTFYKISRRITSIEKVRKEECQCIYIDHPDHLYITNNYIVTHNTLVGTYYALEKLLKKRISNIIITRPTVSKEEVGFLPGDLREKMNPWMQPIYRNFYQLTSKTKIDYYLSHNQIEIIPIAFTRGITYLDSVVIVDEAQNITHEQMKMVLTRIGLRSKIIVCGDTGQIDLRKKEDSALDFIIKMSEKINRLGCYELLENHRQPIVKEIIEHYEKYK